MYCPLFNTVSPILTRGLGTAGLDVRVPRLVLLDAELERLLGSADIAVPRPVLAELEFLAEEDRTARAALRLASKYRTIEASGSADDALLDFAKSQGAAVVTLDQPLLDRLQSAGVPRIFLRSRNHLVAEGL